MTLAEFNAWRDWDQTNPITDRRRIYGPAALVSTALGGSFADALEFLHPKTKRPTRPLRPVEVIRAPKE